MTSVDERLNADKFAARKPAFGPQATSYDIPAADQLSGDSTYEDVPTRNPSSVDAAIATHQEVLRIYEEAWNAHTFDFESDVGHFIAPDLTIVSGGILAKRSMLRELYDARADYVRTTRAKATIRAEITHVTDMDTTVLVVAESELSFTYPDPDRAAYAEQLIVSSTLRLLGSNWVFQHIHFGRACF